MERNCSLEFLIIIIVIIYFVYVYLVTTSTTENFGVAGSDAKSKIYDEIKKEYVTDGRLFTDDALFTDLIYYENDDEVDGTLGLEKCIAACSGKGICVEYGISGNAYCFPYDDKQVKENYKNKLIESSKPVESETKNT